MKEGNSLKKTCLRLSEETLDSMLTKENKEMLGDYITTNAYVGEDGYIYVELVISNDNSRFNEFYHLEITK